MSKCNHHQVSEGLRVSDLADLVLPVLSIDEYESKISDTKDIIVVGFFVEDEDPANELSKFIDGTTIEIIDTDVSPAPTEQGYFVVFVEIARDEEFYGKIQQLVKEIDQITNTKKWYMKPYKYDEVVDLTEDNLEDYVRIHENTHEHFVINQFFKHALVEDVRYYEDRVVVLEKNNKIYKLKLDDELFEENLYDFKQLAESQRLDNALGAYYTSAIVDDKVSIRNLRTGKVQSFRKA